MTLLAIDWSSVAVKTGQFILSFSILVVLHELGHFLPARWFKCRVEKFYLFFNPWFSLFKKKVGETEYGIGWVPFGGYVKISGMVDESMDKEQMKLPPQPHEFRSKPAWQRLIIMIGGVVVNIILSIFIFIAITWVWGEEYLPPQNAKYGLTVDSVGKAAGLRDGDMITKLNNEPVKDVLKLSALIVSQEATQMTVVRDGKEMQLPIPAGTIRYLNDNRAYGFATLRLPNIVNAVSRHSANGNLHKGDQILAVNGKPTVFGDQLNETLKGHKDQNVVLTIKRDGKEQDLLARVNPEGAIGIEKLVNIDSLGFTTEVKKYSFLESIPAGFKRCGRTLSMYVTGIKQLFTGKANPNKSLGSVISIGSVFSGVWDWESFWTLTAVFSIILAFMNILPIPALDGGHALFCIIEMITGRKPSDKFMEIAQTVGMVLLLGLMAYALGLDFWRIFKN